MGRMAEWFWAIQNGPDPAGGNLGTGTARREGWTNHFPDVVSSTTFRFPVHLSESVKGITRLTPVINRLLPYRRVPGNTNATRARVAERSVVQQQLTEGNVLAPASGRILKKPVTTGTVVLAGEPVAMVAEQNFVLRLRVPERHARFLKAGDSVRIDAAELGGSGPQFGGITLVYPQIAEGRVVADAQVDLFHAES
jgi:hypothetical protein